ncbi:MAG TPA: SDR family oxidoreductase [Candidatus Binatia bacterium]|nr:SDR family oxidoreductase [Candidatus Binatia bacterium]
MAQADIGYALVTGASAGIGQATARILARQGVTVYAAARRSGPLEELAREAAGIRPIALDVTSDESMRAAMARIESDGARIDLLVNNAGFGQMGAVEDVSVEKLRYQFEVNVFGAVRAIQAVLPGMRARRSGRIVNVSSPAGVVPMPFGGAYCASKAALESLTAALRLEVRDFGIHCILVRPGAIRTEFQEVARDGTTAFRESSPYAGRYGSVERLFDQFSKRGSPPEPVGEGIVRAALAASPPHEINVPFDAKATVALSTVLPSVARDGIFRFALNRLG